MAKNTKKQNIMAENAIKMTQDAYDELVKELENRQNNIRKEIADEIAAARDLGDLSENYAYTAAMEKKELNENRILEIEDVIIKAVIVEENLSDNFVGVGEQIEIQNQATGKSMIIQIVGTEDTRSANPNEGKISSDSPIGKAVFNARYGDIVEVNLPSGVVKYKVNKVSK